jgi:WD40 repeat protein
MIERDRAVRSALTWLALVLFAGSSSTVFAGPPGAIGDLYVSSDVDNTTRQYDPISGALLGDMYTTVAATGQMAIHFGETNDRVLIGHLSGGVEEFDATSGAYIKTYNAGGGWQWGALYAPNGNVYIGDQSTNDVREYDSTTGAFVSILTTVDGPADMRIGPNGNLFICSYTGYYVKEVDANTGAFVDQWSMGFGDRVNDIAFLPSGDILVTVGGANVCHRYDSAKNLLGSFTGAGWGRPHGVDIGPTDGNIYIADGVTTQVHVFDPVTFTELNTAFLVPNSGSKIVDVVFRPTTSPVSIAPESWGTIKGYYR